jgi:hypothetical protein
MAYPRSGFSGGGGTSRKSFFRPDRGRAIVGVIVEGNLLCMFEGNFGCIVEGSLPGIVGVGLPLRALAFKIRRKNESRITAKMANLIHEFESIAGS